MVSWPPLIFPPKSHFTGTKIHENSSFYSKQGSIGIDRAARLMKTINLFCTPLCFYWLYFGINQLLHLVKTCVVLCLVILTHTFLHVVINGVKC